MLKLNFYFMYIIRRNTNNLNTSHVKVKQFVIIFFCNFCIYLNTSHVKVKRKIYHTVKKGDNYLNTSHVKVKPIIADDIATLLAFKYISC